MKLFKDPETSQVYAYESDGSQDAYILQNLVMMSQSEIDAHLNANQTQVPPLTVSMRQARLALFQVGLLEQVDAAIASGGEPDRISWEYATEVRRDDTLVANMASALGLTNEQLDGLFTLAATL